MIADQLQGALLKERPCDVHGVECLVPSTPFDRLSGEVDDHYLGVLLDQMDYELDK